MPGKRNVRKISDLQRQLNSLKQSINGRSLHPRGDPGSVTAKPWNTLTVIMQVEATSHTFTVSTLVTGIQQQLGLPTSVKPEFKLLTVQMWCKAPAATIGMDIYSADDTDNAILTTEFDRGSGSNLAAVGYQYPSAHNRRILYGTTEDSRTVATYVTSSGGVESRFRILWRIR